MKKYFSDPELELLKLSVSDVIATSPEDYGDDDLGLPMV